MISDSESVRQVQKSAANACRLGKRAEREKREGDALAATETGKGVSDRSVRRLRRA
jgi:hypothetical protein